MHPTNRFSSRTAAVFAAVALLMACGDENASTNQQTCSPGELCPCTTPSDCPTGETCSAAQLCVPASDASSDTDASPEPDITEDTTTDTGDDAETTEPDVEEDVPSETVVDADTETPDTDTSEPDTADTEEPDTDTTPEDVQTDSGGFPPPGNPWIAYIQGEQLRFIKADGTGDIAWAGPESDLVFSADWSPNGQQLAVLAADEAANGGLQVLNFVTRTVTLVDLELDGMEIKPFTSVAWSPDGETIAFSYRPRGTGTLSGIYTISVADVAGGSAIVPTRVATPVSGDTYPVWGPDSGDLYFVRTDNGDTSIVRMEFPGGAVEEVVGNLDILGVFDISGTEDLFIAQVPGAGASGALSTVDFDEDDNAFGNNGDAAPSFFPPGDNRVAIVRNFAAGGTPQNDMVIIDLDTSTPNRITNTGAAAGPAFMSVSPIDNSEQALGPFPF